MSVRVRAFAKVNWGLRVLPLEAGAEFHGIESVFQTVGFADEVEAELSGGPGCEVVCSAPLPVDNTLSRTFEAFSELTGIRRGVRVSVDKRIPAGGGLGGGSSDAAAFLRALCALNSVELGAELADSVAARVGSDVFFFLNVEGGRGAALVSGRGEVVRGIPARRLDVVLAFPGVFSSTREAYAEFDARGESLEFPPFSEYAAEYASDVRSWRFRNSFTPILAGLRPEIAEGISLLRGSGADFADMSGSGSTVFGVFPDADSAARAAENVRAAGLRCVAVQAGGSD